MPRFSAFTPFGVFRFSSKPSPGKLFYEQLKQLYASSEDAQQPFDFTKPVVVSNVTVEGSGHLEASLYARARALARAQMVLEKAGANKSGATAYDLIPLLELDYQLTPGPTDTYVARQQAIAAAQRAPLGNTFANMLAGLKGILGASFIDYRPAPLGSSSASSNPPVAGVSNSVGRFADVRVPPKFMQLVDPVHVTGAPIWCAYQNLDTTTVPVALSPGDLVSVQSENTLVMEVVQVTAVANAPPAGSNATALTPPARTPSWSPGVPFAVGQLVQPTSANATGFWFRCTSAGITGATEPAWPAQFGVQVTDGSLSWVAIGASTVFQASFHFAHDVGASLVIGNLPYWWSQRRHNWIVVTSAAAADRETRRKVDEFMRKSVRGVSTWAIVAGTITSPGHYAVSGLSANLPMGSVPMVSQSV